MPIIQSETAGLPPYKMHWELSKGLSDPADHLDVAGVTAQSHEAEQLGQAEARE